MLEKSLEALDKGRNSDCKAICRLEMMMKISLEAIWL